VSGDAAAPRVIVLADDLIWATRLVDGVRRSGGEPVPARTAAGFASALPGADGVLVDLTARAYDGLAALGAATDAGVPAIAVGQHDDAPLRAAAKAAGAARVYAYRALFERGDRELAAWLQSIGHVQGATGTTEEDR
jgi:hypothetical protein